MVRASDGRNVRSIEELMAFYSYKGENWRRPVEDIVPPATPPPRREKPFSIRVSVGGQTRVVSSFFPLPPGASNPVPIRNRPRTRTPNSSKPRPKILGTQENEKPRFKNRTRKTPRKSTQLSAREKKSDCYRRVGADHMWDPPPSCHNLLQERHSFDPWRVLIICMLLNVTTGTQVRKVLSRLFMLCPTAEEAVKVGEEEIERVIQSLGLQTKRAKAIKRFSCEYLGDDWTHVTQLHGIGKYAADAYAIFCVGKPEDVIPNDHKLIDYWKFVCGKV